MSEISAVGSGEEEVFLSEALSDMAMYTQNRDPKHQWKKITGIFFLVRALYSHVNREESSYKSLSNQYNAMSKKWVLWQWDNNRFCHYLRELSQENPKITRKELDQVIVACLKSINDEIPNHCEWCMESHLETARAHLLGISFLLSRGPFSQEVKDIAIKMAKFYMIDKAALRREGGLALRNDIQQLLGRIT